ncbi:MAG: S-layer homology domain-containing protein [Clostridiales bacterium]|nr:MAG: S-layer homology domain-containing protein [Clostridiales bacterium]
MVTCAIGLKGADAECSFTDVSADDWFYAPVAAAVRASVISGISKDKFGTGQKHHARGFGGYHLPCAGLSKR